MQKGSGGGMGMQLQGVVLRRPFYGMDANFVVNDVYIPEKEDLNGPLPHLRLSCKNWSGRFVGRA